MHPFGLSCWKSIPFLRILLPFTAGILIQYYGNFSILFSGVLVIAGVMFFGATGLFSLPKFYRFRWLPGVGLHLLFGGLGAALAFEKNMENDANWIGRRYQEKYPVMVTIAEPLVEKTKSYKVLAKSEAVLTDTTMQPVAGNILLYFLKDSSAPAIGYGTQLIIHKPLQAITNSGNPGGFNYKRYCAFQDIFYQAFLKPGEYTILPSTNRQWFSQLLISCRQWVLFTLRKYITNKNERAVAEALLIGYRDDLDKELVQSYSNTGVVHIIAISGLHLGMIYGMMAWIFARFKPARWKYILKPLIILLVLWMFTFIAGAVPSILRSAIMFSCMVVAESLMKKTSVYNTLAASAFMLLLINPFYLWDVGFQLSFAAVLSIIAFFKPLTRLIYFKNKMLAGIWKLCSISLSAQILTLPVVLYHFHQFPNLFLFTNLIIVPLSGLILFAELILLIVASIPMIGEYWSQLTEWALWLMNTFIERTNRLPFAVTDGIQVTLIQSVCIYAAIIAASLWLLQKNKKMLLTCGFALAIYLALRSVDVIQAAQQQKLIVYHVPQHTAIDIVEAGHYRFYGDSILLQDGFLRNFHLRPSRIVNRMDAGALKNILIANNTITSAAKRVVIIDHPLQVQEAGNKIPADVIIITKNPRLYMNQLLAVYQCKLVVFDATNPTWKIRLWKKDCDSLHLRHYSVPEQGAFQMDL